MSSHIIKRALISVSDKSGIVEFARELIKFNIEILSTGGTAKLLRANKIPVMEISEYTNFPEIMGGRVKTLHPKVMAGILARRSIDNEIMEKHHINPIDLVVVNLYPFANVVAQENCQLEDAIENIDVGGPTMLRAAAKNYQDVTVIVNINDYQSIIEEMTNHSGATTLDTRFKLAQKVFVHTADYDLTIASYLNNLGQDTIFKEIWNLVLEKKQDLRYGENPHQKAAFYKKSKTYHASVTTAEQLQGKELSFNNITDADAALECVKSFIQPTCVIVKHANPCGVATSNNILSAYEKAFKADPQSAFGGVIAFNRALDVKTAQKILTNQFVELIIAPEIEPEAMQALHHKESIRILASGNFPEVSSEYDYKKVSGGMLIQERDLHVLKPEELSVVTKKSPSESELKDLMFAWNVVKHVKSNAIVIAKDLATIGIGAGQMSRVDSVFIAITKAKNNNFSLQHTVMASDAFFPFADSIEMAAQAGISAIIQPGGSVRDKEVIAAADKANMAMIFTGIRHFRH